MSDDFWVKMGTDIRQTPQEIEVEEDIVEEKPARSKAGFPSDDANALQQRASGFPSDDHYSLQQLCGDSANLETWYNNQFVQNEQQPHMGGGQILSYQIEFTPVLAGTMTGTINFGNQATQTFVANMNGGFTFTSIGQPQIVAVGGNLNLITGTLTLTWNANPGQHVLGINYEYSLEQFEQKPKQDKETKKKLYSDLVNELYETRRDLEIAKSKLKDNEKLEVELYDEYDKRLKETKDYMITKLDQFLQLYRNDSRNPYQALDGKTSEEIYDEAMK